MSKKKKIIKFQVGDRVAERPKDNYIPMISPEKVSVVLKNSTQRTGQVTGIVEKRDARKHLCTYYNVSWDNNTTSQHAQFRLCHEHELAAILAEYRAAIE